MLKTVEDIDKRLEELRQEYKTASEAKRKFIEVGAKILKDHKLWLSQKETENANI